MIIGISGKKRVGKNTVGMYLQLKYGYATVALAEELKRIARLVGWDGKKDERGRTLLQQLGTEVVRAYDPDFWVRELERRVNSIYESGGALDFAVTDIRYPNEADWVKSQGGVILRVWSKDEITNDTHISETALDNYDFDYKVESIYGDFNDLYRKVDAIIPNLSTPVLGGGEAERVL